MLLLVSAALAQTVTLPDPVPWTLDDEVYNATLEAAAGYAATLPEHATTRHLDVRAYGPDGVLRPLEAYAPKHPPVPVKEGEPLVAPPQPAADHPGEGQGALSGKAVYLSQCHGWIWYDSLNSFSTQRGNLYDTVEDFHNPEGADVFLSRYLENAGARVFTARERDLNPLMAIADNDGQGYSEQGSGFTDGLAGFMDQGEWGYGEDPFDAGTTRSFPADGGAVATWTPDVPADGRYAVYVSWDARSDNASDAHYRITHPGGVIDRTFDQTVHGSTWQYVEDLWLPEGEGGLVVELIGDSTQSGRLLSADAVRVGGGVTDVTRHGQNPDRPRWEEGATQYIQWNGAPTSVYDPSNDGDGSDPSSRSRWADWEHPSGEDAVYVSWHSNAGGGTGTSIYTYEGSNGPAVSGSEELAELMLEEIIDATRTLWDPDWTSRGHRTAAFAEVNPYNNDETPAALIELAFHDHAVDVELLKDPAYRRDASRAIYRGIVRYFAWENGTSPAYLPEPPVALTVRQSGAEIVLSWEDGPTGAPYGDAPSAWRVYTSADGRSWDNGVDVDARAHVITGQRAWESLFVRVTAVNAGGESFPTEVLGANRAPDGVSPVLVVGAFDRLQVSQLPYVDVGGAVGVVARFTPARVNPYDLVARHGRALGLAGWPFDSASDEALPDIELSDYRAVIWAAGEESTTDESLSDAQQAQLRLYVETGGTLIVSGSEVLWDLDYRGGPTDQAFAADILGAGMASDDSGSEVVDGEGLLEGLALDFDEAGGAPYPNEYPDVLDSTREVVARYGSGGIAGVIGQGVAHFGFPLDCIGDEPSRADVLGLLLGRLVPDYEPGEPVDTGITDDTGGDDTGDDTGLTVGSGQRPGQLTELGAPKTGCGCGGGLGGGGWAVALAILGLARRRPRGSG